MLNSPVHQYILGVLVLMSYTCGCRAQSTGPLPDDKREIFEALKAKDSLLFHAAFVTCDTITIKALISEDFEFYHDQSGITDSKEAFIEGIRGLCALPYKPRRELEAHSLEAFPLYNQGKLYGAIQTGTHRFYAKEKDKDEYLTSTAKFTHLWILESGEWRLKRVLSYHHIAPLD